MIINSELPVQMLNENNNLNEYDFVLFHLYKELPLYREYFLNQRKTNPDRLMILDNSAYEFYIKGEKLDLKEFRDCIIELKPDLYILPDVLMDKEQTLKNVSKFMLMMLACHKRDVLLNCEPLAVAQGNSTQELIDCLHTYQGRGIRNIAIPFHNSFFKEDGIHADTDIWNEFYISYEKPINEDRLYAMGRVQFMRNNFDLLKQFKHVHFLGSHCPLEKVFYKDFNTMDTGYPVKCAIVGDKLFRENNKPNIIIDDMLSMDLSNECKELIRYNIDLFKKL